jgi:selenocysteine lyase/cysteine desulfurase
MAPICLDNNATTRVDAAVVEAMLPFFTEYFGNASSIHAFGSDVGKALKKAHAQVQALLGAEHDSEIIFTSYGTESDSTAILSSLKAQPERNTVITTNVEHPAILTLCEWLEKEGYIVHQLKVDKKGRLEPRRNQVAAQRPRRRGLGDVGQQRDRHNLPGRGNGRTRRRQGHHVPHRRGAGRRQDSARPEGHEDRHALALGA